MANVVYDIDRFAPTRLKLWMIFKNQTICMHVNISDKVVNFRNDTEL